MTGQVEVNAAIWRRGSYVADYANRRLLPVEVMIMVRYREALTRRVLEVGCGAGRVLGYLVALGGEVYGIDISPAMVEHCAAAYPRAQVRVGDLAALQQSIEGRFSAILAIDNVLDVFGDEQRRAVLADLRAALEPDGLLIFSSHNLDYAVPGAGGQSGRPLSRLLAKAAGRPLAEVAAYALHTPRRIRNRRRLARLERREDDHAIINDQAHDYGLLHYYIGRDAQARQLSDIGYELVEALDAEGAAVPAGQRSPSPWLHYIARPGKRP